MHRKCTWRILGDFEESQCWDFASEEDGWLSLARSGLVSGVHVLGGWQMEKPSRKCFSYFGIPMFYVIYARYEHYMYVSHIRIMGMLHLGGKYKYDIKL